MATSRLRRSVLLVAASLAAALLASKLSARIAVPSRRCSSSRRVALTSLRRSRVDAVVSGSGRRADRDPLRRRLRRSACGGSARRPSRRVARRAGHVRHRRADRAVRALGARARLDDGRPARRGGRPDRSRGDVLGARRPRDRAAARDTILEGESGANDPVGIALMLGLIELATHADETFWVVVAMFALQMAIGLLVGDRRRPRRGAGCCARLGRSAAWITLALAAARRLRRRGASRTARASSRSSSRGCSVGDVEAPRQGRDRAFHERLATRRGDRRLRRARPDDRRSRASAAERWARGPRCSPRSLALARAPGGRARRSSRRVRLALGERAVRHLGRPEGRGADPARRVRARRHVDEAQRIYETVFVVVLASVVVQGSSIPFAARRLRRRGSGAASAERAEPQE